MVADIGTTLMARARVTRGGPSSDGVASLVRPVLCCPTSLVSCHIVVTDQTFDEASMNFLVERHRLPPPPRVSCVSHRDVVWIYFGFESGKISGTSAVTCRTRTPLAEFEALATFFLFCSVFRSITGGGDRGTSARARCIVDVVATGRGTSAGNQARLPVADSPAETPAPPPREYRFGARLRFASSRKANEKRTKWLPRGCDESERGMRVSRPGNPVVKLESSSPKVSRRRRGPRLAKPAAPPKPPAAKARRRRQRPPPQFPCFVKEEADDLALLETVPEDGEEEDEEERKCAA